MSRPRLRHRAAFAGALMLSFGTGATASDDSGSAPQPMPDPLTLEYALAQANAPHPALQRARADVESARGGLAAARSLTGTRVLLQGRARWVDPANVAPDQSNDDHKLGLTVRRNLYDFGRSDAAEAAAVSEVDSSEWRYQDTLHGRRIRIMERYFDVLLADLRFARENEAMAVAFVTLDRLRDRNELGQVSDIELFEMEADYQRIRRRRAEAQADQRRTRAQLAIALNRPKDLPANLVRPELPQLARDIPSYEELVAAAEENNPLLKALHARTEAARQRVAGARAGHRPLLNAEIEAAEYTRELGSNDNWRAGIELEVPLYSGGAVDALVAERRALLFDLEAQLEQTRRDVRQRILDLWLRLDTLRVQEDEVFALRDYRELYLDRSRAIYELEVKTDLGDAMVRLTEAQLAAAQTSFDIALTWARLDALVGRTPAQASDRPADNEAAPGSDEVGR